MQSRKRRSSQPLTMNSINSKCRKFKSSDVNSIFPRVIRSSDKELIHDIKSEEESDEEYLNYDSESEMFKEPIPIREVENLSIDGEKNSRSRHGKENKDSRRSKTKPKSQSMSRKFFHKINRRGKRVNKNEVNLLPCREKEQEYIYNYLKKGLDTNGSYTTLYISGMPGTGKTACVTTILNKLSLEADKNLNPNFQKLLINGMKIPNPNNVFKVIYDFIFNDARSTSVQKCISILDNFFKNRNDFNNKTILNDCSNSHLILVIDEIDCLINKKQILLYNIFNWSTYPHSKLIIVSISNTLDLPDKLLPKISSRIGNNRLIFKPYQKDELVKILSVKIENFELFSEDAIKMCSMKVAAVNGDLRRILQICSRAKEIYDADLSRTVNYIDKIYVMKAIDDLFDAKVQRVIKSLKLFEKLTLAGILYEMKLQMNTKISVVKVYDRMKYCYMKSLKCNEACPITFEEFTMIIYNMAKIQIISFYDSDVTNFTNSFVNIKFYADEFINAMGDDEGFKEILKELS